MSQRKVTFAEEDDSIAFHSTPKEPEKSLAFGKTDDDDDNKSPANWGAHLSDLNWNANIRALEVELNSNYNYRWWDSKTPQVAIEWPTMRKWATETLQYCLQPGKRKTRFLSQAQQSELLDLFRKCDQENLRFLVFTEPPLSVVENLEQVQNQQSTLPVVNEVEESEIDFQEQQSSTSDKQEAPSVFMDDVWSLSACNVDATMPAMSGKEDMGELDPIEESPLDWEPPGLKDLDFQANLDALSICLNLPINADWDETQTIYIKDAEVRKWASETIVQCIESRIEESKRRDFLELFEKVPPTYLRSVSFLNPVSVLGSIGEPKTDPGAEAVDSDQASDDSDSSVYI